jgi:hypothetical protein
MSSNIISVQPNHHPAGFTQVQFRKLDQLYCSAVLDRLLACRTVECDFDEGVASYTYFLSAHQAPYLQFVIRKVGPGTTMFELFKQGQGRILKSGVFERVYESLAQEIRALAE